MRASSFWTTNASNRKHETRVWCKITLVRIRLAQPSFGCCRAFGHDLGSGRRRVLTAETEEGLKRGHRRASSVVTEDELVEVDLQVLGAHAAVGPAEPGLEVRDRPVRPRQDRVGVAVTFSLNPPVDR